MRLEYFDMIDRVAEFDRGAGRLTAQARVPKESPVFEGHFPGHPLVPGVLLTETMAQAAGHLILALNGHTRMPFLAGVEKAKFRTFVGPDTELTIDAELLHEGSGYSVARAWMSVDRRRICDSELMFRIMPLPEALRALMKERANRIGLPVES